MKRIVLYCKTRQTSTLWSFSAWSMSAVISFMRLPCSINFFASCEWHAHHTVVSIHIFTMQSVLVWHNGNGVGHINKLKLSWAQLLLGLVTTYGGCTIPVFSMQLSLAIPLWVGANHHWGRNGEFCIVVCTAIGGDAIEARRHVPPQILGSGGTLWSVPPPIWAVLS